MLKKTYFHQYSTTEMYSLSRAYFTAEAKDKFLPQERYVAQFPSDHSDKAFLYSYINSSGKKFSIFIPSYIQDDPTNRSTPYDMLLTEALGFIKDHRKKRASEMYPIEEFFLLPLMDMKNKHWSVLKVHLSVKNEIRVEHYDGAVLKKTSIQQTIADNVAEKLAVVTTFPFLLRQWDPVNCGPLSHNIICELAEGKQPRVLPQASFNYRNKDFKLMKTAHAFQTAKQDHNVEGAIFPGVEYTPDKPFLVKHRRTILLCLAAVVGVALLVPLHPLAIGTAVGSAAAWSGLNIAALTAISACIAVPAAILLKASLKLATKGVSGLISLFRPTPQKTFDYTEQQFNTKKYKPSTSYPEPLRIAKRSKQCVADLKKAGFDLQMDSLEDSDDFIEIKAASSIQPRKRNDDKRLILHHKEFLENFRDTAPDDESAQDCRL